MRKYEAPKLVVSRYVADTLIASSNTKNGNPDNNQNCWGCRETAGATDPGNTENSCAVIPGDGLYEAFC